MPGLVRAVCFRVVLAGAGLVVVGLSDWGLLLVRGFLYGAILALRTGTVCAVCAVPPVFCATDLLLEVREDFVRGLGALGADIVCLGSFEGLAGPAKRGEIARPFLESKCKFDAGETLRLWASRERTGPGGGRPSRWDGFWGRGAQGERCREGGAEGLGSLQLGSGQTGLRG